MVMAWNASDARETAHIEFGIWWDNFQWSIDDNPLTAKSHKKSRNNCDAVRLNPPTKLFRAWKCSTGVCRLESHSCTTIISYINIPSLTSHAFGASQLHSHQFWQRAIKSISPTIYRPVCNNLRVSNKLAILLGDFLSIQLNRIVRHIGQEFTCFFIDKNRSNVSSTQPSVAYGKRECIWLRLRRLRKSLTPRMWEKS